MSVIFQGRHCLVYDIGTQHESVEWINLSEVDALFSIVGSDELISLDASMS